MNSMKTVKCLLYAVLCYVLISIACSVNPVTQTHPTPTDVPSVSAPTSTVNAPENSSVVTERSKPTALIPAGSFVMGSFNFSNTLPHRVQLDMFYMDVYEVTNGMYAECVADWECTPPNFTSSETRISYYSDASYENYPVIHVNWSQAADYCAWAGGRLPTEAEWEYAARGGLPRSTYPWGEGIDCQQANYHPSVKPPGVLSDPNPCIGDTSEVGSYAANGFGLYDMAGNVWEWVADWYGVDYYSNSPEDNPGGPASGDYGDRGLRGGSWFNSEGYLNVAYRYGYDPTQPSDIFGFRCVYSSER